MTRPLLTESARAGSLYVVATPIGHLADLSPRAAEILRTVDWIAAEDTRVSRTLATQVGARGRLFAAHQHNEAQAAEHIVGLLREGASVALVSDAGTPAISDPGTQIVSTALAAGLVVIPIPGPSSLTAMVSACGLAEGGFMFEGFLPQRSAPRLRRLEWLAGLDRAIVLFEAPHRIAATCEAVITVFGTERLVALGRELTKRFEEIVRLRAGETLAWLAANPGRSKGEYVLVIGRRTRQVAPGQANTAVDDQGADIAEDMPEAVTPEGTRFEVEAGALLRELVPELGARRASRLVERLAGLASGSLYKAASGR
jgi:16S rRNA (cytidine1402-2'-O)-methyltransferase